MSKLTSTDYNTIVRTALGLNSILEQYKTVEEMETYLIKEYNKHSTDNPNFPIDLQDAIYAFNEMPRIHSHGNYSMLKMAFKHFCSHLVAEYETPVETEYIYKEEHRTQKLCWKGTPAHFAFIIDLLIYKGYLEKPSQSAEGNASLFLKMFEFANHKPSKASLGALLHKEDDPIKNSEHKARFNKIPHRNELES